MSSPNTPSKVSRAFFSLFFLTGLLLTQWGCRHTSVAPSFRLDNVRKENRRTGYQPAGTVRVPKPPPITSIKVISAAELEKFLWEQYPAADIEPLADNYYCLPPTAEALPFIGYTQHFARSVGLTYRKELFDCENFAKLASQGLQLALAKYQPRAQGQCLVATIYVRQKQPWAGVSDGIHALNAIGTINNGGLVILIFEPQNGTWTTSEHYPNHVTRIKIE